ncbi:hypothetical protein [Microbulbifer sp. TYP-18]|uniref:hypothetical protein n=1 Tax=Microbulbifer sp. TYP-18 TaxID=3230024 RepID=UPI0034C6A531
MCSVFDVDDDAGIERFLQEYGVRHPERMIFGRRRRPTQQVSTVTAGHGVIVASFPIDVSNRESYF